MRHFPLPLEGFGTRGLGEEPSNERGKSESRRAENSQVLPSFPFSCGIRRKRKPKKVLWNYW